MGNELVEVFAPNETVKGPDEVKALLVRYRAEGIIRVNSIVLDG